MRRRPPDQENVLSAVTGLRLHSFFTAPDGGSADTTIVRQIQVAAAGKTTTAHGIDINANSVSIENCVTRSFKGRGVHIWGNAALATGNANNWCLFRHKSINCDGDGINAEDADGNAGLALACDARSNGGWGFRDNSKLGNTYVAGHAAGNLGGSYANLSTVGYSPYLGCYVEGGTGSATSLQVGFPLVLGGLLAEDYDSPCIQGGGNLKIRLQPGASRLLIFRGNTEIGRIDNDNRLKNLAGFTFVDGNDLFDWSAGLITWRHRNSGPVDIGRLYATVAGVPVLCGRIQVNGGTPEAIYKTTP
ncbi:MAG: hypothetical protein HYS06_06445 [Methylocystis sp.]|nr:hypothetical protein [Methylocystis sp.]